MGSHNIGGNPSGPLRSEAGLGGPLLTSWLIAALASAGTVQTDSTTVMALRPDPVVREEVLDALVLSRSAVLTPVDGGVRAQVQWTVQVRGEREHGFDLVDGSAHTDAVSVDGQPQGAGDGVVRVAVPTGVHTVRWSGWFASEDAVRLLPAPTGTVQVVSSTQVIAGAPVIDGLAWTGAEVLRLQTRAAPVAETGTLVTATVGTGLSIEEDATTVQSRVVVTVRRGEIDEVRLRTSGVGSDLVVSGDDVGSWRREGAELVVALAEPVRSRAEVRLQWTTDSEGSLAVPRIDPVGVFRVQAALQVSRPDDVGVRPQLTGWRAVARSQVPAWGADLVEGPPRLAYLSGGQGSGSLAIERFEPIVGPPVIVDVADWSIATTQEGRSLVRGFLEVRNERASHLHIDVPAGYRLLSVQVSGTGVAPVQQDGKWLIPLERSLETIEGLISFPIEVALLGDGSDWARREDRRIELPTLGAPVQAARSSLVLPVDYRPIGLQDAPHHVEAFSSRSGLSYGFGIGEVGAAEADRIFQAGIDAWMVNDFEEVERSLDALEAMGAESGNIDRLQSNLYAVTGRADDVDEAALRRVREQAQARSAGQQRFYAETQQLAREAEQRGDYAASSAYLEQALDVGQNLSLLEGDEVEVSVGNAVIEERLSKVAERRQALEDASRDAGRWAGAVQSDALPWEVDGEMPFDVEGEPWWLSIDGDGGLSGSGGGSSAVGYGIGSGAMGVAARGQASTYDFDGEPVVGRSYEASYEEASDRRGFLGGLFSRRKNGLPAPEVQAASASLSVPVLGEVVRFEQLLLPADVPFFIELTARSRRSL